MAQPSTKVRLDPVPLRVDPVRRLPQLFGGLIIFGFSEAMMVRGQLGLGPWAVLHEGMTLRTGLSFGTCVLLTGLLVMLLWIPLRQRPGFGTLANIVVVAVTVDLSLWLLPAPETLPAQAALLVGGVALNGVATACYIGARLGPGPRDGLMTGLAARSRFSVRLIRTGIELSVLAIGWLLGGTVGLGTILFALSIGPLAQFFLPRLAWRDRKT